MSSVFPCPESLSGCDCSEFPVRNFSQAAADLPVCFGHFNQPPTAGTFFEPGCFAECDNLITTTEDDCEVLAQECAARDAVECSGDPPSSPPNDPFFPVLTIYANAAQTCSAECSDGTTFDWTVAAGTVKSFWQADANARAYGLACKRANEHKVCFVTESPLDPICASVPMSVAIVAAGGTPGDGYVFELIAGSLPAGLSFDAVGLITGTPTTGGTSTFTIRVTDSIGSFQIKQFELRVVKITSPASLPAGSLGTAYSYTLLKTGTSGTVLWSLTSGTLPAGLSLSTSGVISGTPTGSGTSTFMLELLDGTGASCSKEFTIVISGALLAYWSFEAKNGAAIDDVSGQNHPLNGVSGLTPIVPGIIANALQNLVSATLSMTGIAAPFDNPGTNGVTVAGWINIDAGNNSGAVFAIHYWSGAGLPNFSLILEANFGALSFFWSTDFSISADSPVDISGGWHFYRAWLDPDDATLNLQIDNGTIYTSLPNAWPAVPLFAFETSTTGLSATFDETGYWKRVLTDAEAANLWNGGAGITWGNPLMPP